MTFSFWMPSSGQEPCWESFLAFPPLTSCPLPQCSPSLASPWGSQTQWHIYRSWDQGCPQTWYCLDTFNQHPAKQHMVMPCTHLVSEMLMIQNQFNLLAEDHMGDGQCKHKPEANRQAEMRFSAPAFLLQGTLMYTLCCIWKTQPFQWYKLCMPGSCVGQATRCQMQIQICQMNAWAWNLAECQCLHDAELCPAVPKLASSPSHGAGCPAPEPAEPGEIHA